MRKILIIITAVWGIAYFAKDGFQAIMPEGDPTRNLSPRPSKKTYKIHSYDK